MSYGVCLWWGDRNPAPASHLSRAPTRSGAWGSAGQVHELRKGFPKGVREKKESHATDTPLLAHPMKSEVDTRPMQRVSANGTRHDVLHLRRDGATGRAGSSARCTMWPWAQTGQRVNDRPVS